MQELTFEQVESVSGGFFVTGNELRNIVEDLKSMFQFEAQCQTVDSQPISPNVQAFLAFITGIASAKNIAVGAALGAISTWMVATAGSSSQFCPQKTMTQEELAKAIDEGLRSGGPL